MTSCVLFFETPHDFRRWLAGHHDRREELWVGYYKKATGKPSITWPESVDEALCFGWIDGLRKTVDEEAYKIRFTPRRRGSNWSRVNLERVEALREAGRMTPAGMAAYEARDPGRSGYSFANDEPRLADEQVEAFRARPRAWEFWTRQPPGYRRRATGWVVSAKRASTRERRLATLIEDSENGVRIKQLRRG